MSSNSPTQEPRVDSRPSFFRYENGIVMMMFFTFGFVFMERLSIVFLFPFIAPDLKLNNTHIGMIVSVLAICWALSGYLFGSISDVSGSRKKVLLPITLAFSIFSFLTGLARTFTSMIIVRGLMGISEGPVLPIAQASVIAESTPKRRGFNLGFVQSSLGLLGATITPILVTAIATKYSWHAAFYVVGLPGLIMFFVLLKYMREPRLSKNKSEEIKGKVSRKDFAVVYKNRNIWLCTIMSGLFMTWLFVFTTFAPTFLIEVDKFKPEQMGLIMAAIGMGSFVWGFIGPAISDKIGRRPTLVIFSIVASLSPLSLAIVHGSLGVMMILGFFTAVGQGVFPLILAIIPGETLPLRFVATAVATTQMIGELTGGTIAPTLAGVAADHYGLQAPLYIAFAGAFISGLIAFGVKETAPARTQSSSSLGVDAV